MSDQETVREILGQLEDDNRLVDIFCELLGALNSMMSGLAAENRPLPNAVVEFLESYRRIVDPGSEPEAPVTFRLH